MLTIALIVALAAPIQDRVPDISLGSRTGTIAEPFSDAMGMAELVDGRVIVSDRVDAVFSLADFSTGARRTIGRNGSGPNEYQMPLGPIRWRGDTLLGSDPLNRRVLKILPDGSINGSIPLVSMRSASGTTSWSTPKSVDASGRLYWHAPIIDMQPVMKRSMKARLIRWDPGSDSPDVVLEFADHGEFEHKHRYRPMPQTDAWVIAPDGRIAIISAAEYRLRWYKDGALVETGPAVPYTPTRITRAERDAFRAKKALEPMSGASAGGAPPRSRRQDPAAVLAAWPDSLFEAVMPPFEPQGALLAANGDIWVRRTGPASAPAARVDILDPHGKLRAHLTLPPRARLFALGARHVYLLLTDSDGFQSLERYEYPVLR
jgi:hypothetical protein